MDEEEANRLRSCITAMQETLAATDDPDISLISDYFKETFEIRRNFVKTHNTTEILTEYPALQLHSCVRISFHFLFKSNL
jgi:signal transduction histidine kinase